MINTTKINNICHSDSCSNNSQCKTCGHIKNYCYSCKNSLTIYNPFNNKCESNCPQSTYKENEKCLKCNSHCKSCKNNANICEICSFNKLWDSVNNKCVNKCQSHQFIYLNNFCNDCDNNCETCENSSTQCKSCYKNSENSFFNFGKCVKKCDQEQVVREELKICVENCENSNCYTCDKNNKSLCLTCIKPLPFLFNNDCYKTKCKENCKKCENYGKCLECQQGKSFIFENNCYEKCPINSFLLEKSKCEKCDKKCQKCFNKANNVLYIINFYFSYYLIYIF